MFHLTRPGCARSARADKEVGRALPAADEDGRCPAPLGAYEDGGCPASLAADKEVGRRSLARGG